MVRNPAQPREDFMDRFDDILAALAERHKKVSAETTTPAAPPSPSPGQFAPKVFLCLLGAPGAGKTTQLKKIQELTGAPVFHVGRFVEKHFPAVRTEEQRMSAGLLQGFDELFLKQVLDDPSRFVILDGFPRTPEQAQLLLKTAAAQGIEIKPVCLQLGSSRQEIETSFQRQITRDTELGQPLTKERYLGKIGRYIDQDLAALKVMRDAGLPVVNVDAQKIPDHVFAGIKTGLGLDLARLPYDRGALKNLRDTAKQLGIEAYIHSGAVYRAAFNNAFGPPRLPTDIDVCCNTPGEAARLQSALEAAHPTSRWKVVTSTITPEGEQTGERDALQTLFSNPLTFRQVGIRMTDSGDIEVHATPAAVHSLLTGKIYFDRNRLDYLPAHKRDQAIDAAITSTKKTLRDYPGLVIDDGLLESGYGQRYGAFESKEVISGYEKLHSKVVDAEKGAVDAIRSKKKLSPEDSGKELRPLHLTPEERAFAEKVCDFYRHVDKTATAPFVPERAPLPAPLEKARRDKIRLRFGQAVNPQERQEALGKPIPAPAGFDSWLHYAVTELPDASFREWLLNQTRSRRPFGGKDPQIDMLEKPPMDKVSEAFSHAHQVLTEGEQKVTHQGLDLHQHLFQSTLQLATDEVIGRVRAEGHSEPFCNKLRSAMRVAMLHHDLGKLVDISTPGLHESMGARIFRYAMKPVWVDEHMLRLAEWMIVQHDLFGRVARGITEKVGYKIQDPNFDPDDASSYEGAIVPGRARDKILAINRKTYGEQPMSLETATAVIKEIWKADMGSVASLRWLLPVTDLLEQVVARPESLPKAEDVPKPRPRKNAPGI